MYFIIILYWIINHDIQAELAAELEREAAEERAEEAKAIQAAALAQEEKKLGKKIKVLMIWLMKIFRITCSSTEIKACLMLLFLLIRTFQNCARL